MLPKINSCLNVGQTSTKDNESPFLQRLASITPRGKPVVPLEIQITSSEGLLEEDQQRLNRIVTEFEQRRLKSLIKEPKPREETGFFSKTQGFQIRPKVFSKKNYEKLAGIIQKQHSTRNALPYPYELGIPENEEKVELGPATNELKPVTTIKEKERLKSMIRKSQFVMSPLELKQLKDKIRISE